MEKYQPKVHTVALDSFEPEAMTETLQRGSIEHVLLGPGRFRGQLLHAQLNGTRLDWGCYNRQVFARGLMAPDRLTLGFLLDCPEPCRFNGLSVPQHSMLLFTENQELHTRLASGASWLGVQLEREMLEQSGIELPHKHLAKPSFDRPYKGLNPVLMKSLIEMRDTHPPSGLQLAKLVGGIQDVMVSTLSQLLERKRTFPLRPVTGKRHNPYELVRAAETYMDAHLSEAITITGLCAAIDSPIHSLERAFSKIHGVNPRQFLNLRRLTVLRGILLSHEPGQTSVTEAALHCGLTHLGRVAARYKTLFDESPSATLKRAAVLSHKSFHL